MIDNQKIVKIGNRLRGIEAAVQTVSFAIGNREIFGDATQNIAVTLDSICAELKICCEMVESLVGETKEKFYNE